MKNWKLILAGILAITIIGYVVFLLTRSVELPTQLAGVPRIQLIDGEKANTILDRMHDKEVTPTTNIIAVYEDGNSNAVVYLSVYRSSDDARKAYGKMAQSIEKGNILFTDYRAVRINDIDASFCLGQGQDHYFFVNDDRLYWLAADRAKVEAMVLELIAGM